jgi:hypothetical protein
MRTLYIVTAICFLTGCVTRLPEPPQITGFDVSGTVVPAPERTTAGGETVPAVYRAVLSFTQIRADGTSVCISRPRIVMPEGSTRLVVAHRAGGAWDPRTGDWVWPCLHGFGALTITNRADSTVALVDVQFHHGMRSKPQAGDPRWMLRKELPVSETSPAPKSKSNPDK